MPRLISKSSFWLFVVICLLFFLIVVGGLGVILWDRLSPAAQASILQVSRQHIDELIGLAVILAVGLVFIIDWVFRLYILPIDRLTEEVEVIFHVNPAQRIRLHGSREAMRLATTLNTVADCFEDMKRSVEERIREAGTRVEAEKQLLARVVGELPQGILICNAQGQITLYNEPAKQLLQGSENHRENPAEAPTGEFVGLGRSVFGVLDKNIIRYALSEIDGKMRRGQHDLNLSLVANARGDRLLQVDFVPILGDDRDLTGFALILSDITRHIAIERQEDALLQTLLMKLRAAVASIRSAIEIIHDYPGLEAAKRQQLQDIIRTECQVVATAMDRAAADFSLHASTRWPLARLRLNDLLAGVRKRSEEKLGIHLSAASADDEHWVRADTYTLGMALLFILDRLRHENKSEPMRLSTQRLETMLAMDIFWNGNPVRADTIRRWEGESIAVADEGIPSTLGNVLRHHGINLLTHAGKAGADESYLRILLPAASPKAAAGFKRSTLLPVNRPVFFDYDLFSRPEEHPELDDRILTELSYTAFDTETTGLDPRGGDEIISIGAVRIINGKMLEEESFERLVDPQRLIPWSSVQIHGIQPQVLEGQPSIAQVLPMFYKYAEGTVLVGHNVAFDMRMLQEKEAATGIRFGNQVLDTMLISAVVNPAQQAHDLEAIAERLGVAIIGRHTALGDAIGTAEVFLKMIPLLAGMGIRTLKQVREASQQTYFARLQY